MARVMTVLTVLPRAAAGAPPSASIGCRGYAVHYASAARVAKVATGFAARLPG